MKRITSLATLLCASALACSKPQPATDTTALALDTVKPAVVTVPDTAAVTTPTPAKATATGTFSKAPAQVKKDSTARAKDSIIGRDSVIRTNPRDPRRQIPTKPPF